MLIEQVINLRNVRIENLKDRTDFKIKLWMVGSVTKKYFFPAADCSKNL